MASWPKAAPRLAKTIEDVIRAIREFPFIGRRGHATGTREFLLPGFPFVLVYELHEHSELPGLPLTVVILAIRPSWQAWPGETPP